MTQVFRPVDVRLQGTGNLTGLFKRRILPATTAEGLNTAVLNFFNAVPASICIVEESDHDIQASLHDYTASLIYWTSHSTPPGIGTFKQEDERLIATATVIGETADVSPRASLAAPKTIAQTTKKKANKRASLFWHSQVTVVLTDWWPRSESNLSQLVLVSSVAL